MRMVLVVLGCVIGFLFSCGCPAEHDLTEVLKRFKESRSSCVLSRVMEGEFLQLPGGVFFNMSDADIADGDRFVTRLPVEVNSRTKKEGDDYARLSLFKDIFFILRTCSDDERKKLGLSVLGIFGHYAYHLAQRVLTESETAAGKIYRASDDMSRISECARNLEITQEYIFSANGKGCECFKVHYVDLLSDEQEVYADLLYDSRRVRKNTLSLKKRNWYGTDFGTWALSNGLKRSFTSMLKATASEDALVTDEKIEQNKLQIFAALHSFWDEFQDMSVTKSVRHYLTQRPSYVPFTKGGSRKGKAESMSENANVRYIDINQPIKDIIHELDYEVTFTYLTYVYSLSYALLEVLVDPTKERLESLKDPAYAYAYVVGSFPRRIRGCIHKFQQERDNKPKDSEQFTYLDGIQKRFESENTSAFIKSLIEGFSIGRGLNITRNRPLTDFGRAKREKNKQVVENDEGSVCFVCCEKLGEANPVVNFLPCRHDAYCYSCITVPILAAREYNECGAEEVIKSYNSSMDDKDVRERRLITCPFCRNPVSHIDMANVVKNESEESMLTTDDIKDPTEKSALLEEGIIEGSGAGLIQ